MVAHGLGVISTTLQYTVTPRQCGSELLRSKTDSLEIGTRYVWPGEIHQDHATQIAGDTSDSAGCDARAVFLSSQGLDDLGNGIG